MNKGILLLFLSWYRKENRERNYIVENDQEGKMYHGIQTDDAPVKYLLDYAASQENQIGKVICIVTQAVKAQNYYEKFQQMVIDYIEETPALKEFYNGEEPVFSQIDYNENVESTEKRAFSIYSQLSRELLLEDSANVYIDYTGGLRDTSFLMTVVIRYLEYMNFKCKKIVYSNLRQSRDSGIIQSIDCVYDLFTLINGVDQFVRTGNAELLEECYKNETDKETRDLLSLIVRFSQVIGICNIRELDLLLPQIGEKLQNYGKKTEKQSLYLRMFSDMIQIIRQKLYIKEGTQLTYPDLIRWFLDNNMIQHALTLYIEKMPVYYYEQGLLEMPEDLGKIPFGTSKEAHAFYTKLFDDRLIDKNIQEFKNALKLLDTDSEYFSLNDVNQLKENMSTKCQKAVDCLLYFLKKYYINGIGERSYTRMKVNPSGNKCPEAKTGARFINQIRDNSDAGAYYFLYNEEYKKPLEGAYERKLRALEKVRNSPVEIKESHVKRETLYNMMEYYCALKLIRNRINHASEAKMTEDEQKAAELLKNRHRLSVEVESKNIKRLISDGLKAHIEVN